LGRAPDALALTAYDALRIVVDARERTGATRGAALRRAVIGTANRHVGVTGRMRLNRAGDRAFGDFDFWSVCRKGTGHGWTRTFEYDARRPGAGRILVRNRC
jgi:branched-chain amino acid transport system substrate-binding protein